MSSSWHLPEALGRSLVGAGVLSCLVNHPPQVNAEPSLLCARLWARDGGWKKQWPSQSSWDSTA